MMAAAAASVSAPPSPQIHSKPRLCAFPGHPHGLFVCVCLLSGRTGAGTRRLSTAEQRLRGPDRC